MDGREVEEVLHAEKMRVAGVVELNEPGLPWASGERSREKGNEPLTRAEGVVLVPLSLNPPAA